MSDGHFTAERFPVFVDVFTSIDFDNLMLFRIAPEAEQNK